MQEDAVTTSSNIVDLSAEIVSAYVARNHVSIIDLPGLIATVHATLNGLAAGAAPVAAADEAEKPTPAQIRKSVTPDALVSFVDGKPYKTLKRHLASHGLDPYSYRARYGLPADYPMVAVNYAAQRSELAKSIGLGRVAGQASAEQPKARGPRKAA
ncbi:MucR family transcriptional regulator [Methylobacterium planeticum]|uniref:MucR family transcriptional regulator n=1 Tax=Methylobacterium planeticum TaxID=2615211 RepID=UPI001FEE77B6|nr:MucR family transcriptional regulator [Methylobacterium planeticum]